MKELRAGVDRGLVASQVCMAKLPWKEPLRLCLVTRVEAERLLGSRAQMAAVTILLSFIIPLLPFLPSLLANQLLLSPVAGNVSSWEAGEGSSRQHTVYFHAEGAEMGTRSGHDLPSPATTHPFLIQASAYTTGKVWVGCERQR